MQELVTFGFDDFLKKLFRINELALRVEQLFALPRTKSIAPGHSS